MKETTINKAEKFANRMIQTFAIHQALEQLKGQPEQIQAQCKPIIIELIEQLEPAEA